MRRITDPAELAAHRLTYVPAAYRATMQTARSKLGEALAYTWADKAGRLCAVVWLGKSQNPYSGRDNNGGPYSFKTADKRRAWVAQCFATAAAIATSRAKRSADKTEQRAKPHGLALGDVLRSSWGYDQTNIDYYEVTRLVGLSMVEVREISQQSEETGFMSGQCVPAPGQYIGPAKRCRVSDYGQRDSVRVSSCAHAYRIAPTIVAGVKLYPASGWTSYA